MKGGRTVSSSAQGVEQPVQQRRKPSPGPATAHIPPAVSAADVRQRKYKNTVSLPPKAGELEKKGHSTAEAVVGAITKQGV